MNRIRPVSFLLIKVLCCLAVPVSLRAQPFSDPTTRWQAATSDAQMAGWEFVANPRSLPTEFLPSPAPTTSSQQQAAPPAITP